MLVKPGSERDVTCTHLFFAKKTFLFMQQEGWESNSGLHLFGDGDDDLVLFRHIG